ncbi:MAG: hydroxyethylthiazole kinase [Archaeoglobaceae archaeon]|uniref:Hydroxyethylthiazole kinase n=1 Tax=Archaeoglobus fulgidus TaxID=2234 RepID=A0A7J3M0H1_ARCFL
MALDLDVLGDLATLRKRRPLIHHIMNFVVMTDSANTTLALGASPIMAHAKEELEDLVSIADAIYINIGTLDSIWIESMLHLAKLAGRYSKPLLLDPVGAGTSKLRTEVSKKILETSCVNVVKGNAGEMMALVGFKGLVKGVDSLVEEAIEPLEKLSEEYSVVAMATGKIDHVAGNRRLASIEGGSELFKYTTGTGCMLGSVLASFMAINRNYFNASLEASLVFKRAGEVAEAKSGRNPANFRLELINALHNIELYGLDMSRVKIKN